VIKDALVKDTILYGGSDFILKVIAFAVFPIYTHLFSVAEYGIIGLIGTIAGLVGLVLNLGLTNAAQRFYFDPETPEADRPALISTGLWILSVWSIMFSAFICIALLFFGEYLSASYGIPLVFLVLALMINIPAQIGQYCLDTSACISHQQNFLLSLSCRILQGSSFSSSSLLFSGWGCSVITWGVL